MNISELNFSQNFLSKVLMVKHLLNGDECTCCNTCAKYIKLGMVPKLSLWNGLDYPDVPEYLQKLTCLEERLCCPRIPFMQIKQLGHERQCGLKGQVVNVPISIDTTVRALPRTLNETYTIQLHIKRKLSYAHDYMRETFRPRVVLNAIRNLLNTQLYRENNITLSKEWNRYLSFDESHQETFIVDERDKCLLNKDENRIMDLTNEENELNPGGNETLLNTIPFQELTLAPGEGQTPLSILMDKDAEELSFPTIHCGQRRNFKIKLSYYNIVKSSVRHYKRKCARVDKLFFMYKKLELLKLSEKIAIYLRKKCIKGEVTVSQVTNETYINNMIQHDDAYKLLERLPTSPAYWKREGREIRGMIRQLGIPTFFITLSSAETKWGDLLRILKKVNENIDISSELAQNLDFVEKANLIRNDPVTCARYFSHRMNAMLNLIKNKKGFFKNHNCTNFYWRIEVQQRGSLHLHGLFWMEQVPKYNKYDQKNVDNLIQIIDQYITTDIDELENEDIKMYQFHRHKKTCKRILKGETICRFKFPKPPLPETMILTPLEDEYLELKMEFHKMNYSRIIMYLNSLDETDKIFQCDDFIGFLSINEISYDDYIMAIRSSITTETIFLRRKMQHIFINGFNIEMLNLHSANMDIQMILNPYAVCNYLVNYIQKCTTGISKILNEAIEEVRNGNYTIRQKLLKISSKFVNGIEISAQEAAYNLLGLPMTKRSVASIFINTFPPEERVKMLKSKQELEKLEPQSNDIFCENMVDYYQHRPHELKNCCLANFVASYEFTKKKERTAKSNTLHKLSNDKGYIYSRQTKKIIRYRRYSQESDPYNFYRENVMLFLPWMNERTDILERNCQELYKLHYKSIELNSKLFNSYENELNDVESFNEEVVDQSDPREDKDDEEYRAFGIQELEHDLSQDFPNLLIENISTIKKSNILMEDQEYEHLILSLNERQKNYLAHVLHNITHKIIFNEFVSGE